MSWEGRDLRGGGGQDPAVLSGEEQLRCLAWGQGEAEPGPTPGGGLHRPLRARRRERLG